MVILSYGNNRYGHPHKEVMDFLEDRFEYFETGKSGSFHLKAGGYRNYWGESMDYMQALSALKQDLLPNKLIIKGEEPYLVKDLIKKITSKTKILIIGKNAALLF